MTPTEQAVVASLKESTPPVFDSLKWKKLRVYANLFYRAQQERIGVANVIRPPEAGGNVRPHLLAQHLKMVQDTEKFADKEMKLVLAEVAPPELIAWQQNTPGIGEGLLALLLGVIGDPCIAQPQWWEGEGKKRHLVQGDPFWRSVGQLWSYCGHGDASRRPRRGMTADEASAMGSPYAKKIVWQMATICIKQTGKPYEKGRAAGKPRVRSPYRDLYDEIRLAVENKVHDTECYRCGPKGHPAKVGSKWSKKHQQAHATRLVGKQILKDIWRVRNEAILTDLQFDRIVERLEADAPA